MPEPASRGDGGAAVPREASRGGPNKFAFGGWKHRASQFFLLLMLFSFPIFSIPCQKGACSSPVEVVALHLLSKGWGEFIAKALLYPGVVFSKVEAVVADNDIFSFPDWNYFLKDINMTTHAAKGEEFASDFLVLIGSYLCIIGAFLSSYVPNTVGAFGMLLLLWHVYKDGGNRSDVFLLPMFAVAMFCALGGFNWNLERSKESRASGGSGRSLIGKDKKQM